MNKYILRICKNTKNKYLLAGAAKNITIDCDNCNKKYHANDIQGDYICNEKFNENENDPHNYKFFNCNDSNEMCSPINNFNNNSNNKNIYKCKKVMEKKEFIFNYGSNNPKRLAEKVIPKNDNLTREQLELKREELEETIRNNSFYAKAVDWIRVFLGESRGTSPATIFKKEDKQVFGYITDLSIFSDEQKTKIDNSEGYSKNRANYENNYNRKDITSDIQIREEYNQDFKKMSNDQKVYAYIKEKGNLKSSINGNPLFKTPNLEYLKHVSKTIRNSLPGQKQNPNSAIKIDIYKFNNDWNDIIDEKKIEISPMR